MSTIELLNWAVRIVHASHEPRDSNKCEWPFCKEALAKIAELEAGKK